jgi:hypothetical protein
MTDYFGYFWKITQMAQNYWATYFHGKSYVFI